MSRGDFGRDLRAGGKIWMFVIKQLVVQMKCQEWKRKKGKEYNKDKESRFRVIKEGANEKAWLKTRQEQNAS